MTILTNFKTYNFVLLFMILSISNIMAQNGTVTGSVTGSDGTALSGASLIASSTSFKSSALAGNDGNYTLSLPPGNYNITASYAGRNAETQKVVIVAGGTVTQNFTLANAADLVGVVVLGSRRLRRVNTETAVPVDVLNISDLTRAAPQTNLNQILNYVAPSFTSNTQTVADGTDHIDPAQLRGLGPDQVLVLLNGKRRHSSSLVNINGTPGRGSVGTDLNAIPAFAIERIEVLRDGAAAQYGSDAIAGVINVVMKKNIKKFTATLSSGANVTKGANDHRGNIDGEQVQLDLNYGVGLGKTGGAINFTGSLLTREDTRRATDYNGQLFNAYNAIENRALAGGVNLSSLFSNINNTPNTAQIISTIKTYAPNVSYFTAAQQSAIQSANTIPDLRTALNAITDANGFITNNELAFRGLERKDFNMRIGQSKLKGGQLFMNSTVPINANNNFYAFGGYGVRDGNSAGFYRRPVQNRTLTELYPNGFLPEIGSFITDASIAAGVKGKLGTWNYDISNTYGQNQFKFTIKNTSNATLGLKSPTQFEAGKLGFSQNTSNIDFSHEYDVLAGLNLALGAELRLENYKIKAGEQSSYERYDINGVPATPTTPATQLPTDFFGSGRPGGAQVFPGFRPENALSKNRNSQAGYIDIELNPTKAWLVNGAVRYENYSDFGSTFSYKFATRIKVTSGLNLRGAVATGFRAPSLQQKYFNSTATQFLSGVPFEIGTFTNESKAAKLLGIPNLKQETSNSYSMGLTYKVPHSNLTLTVDGYLINIKDRIVLTGQFARPSGTPTGDLLVLQQAFDQAGATSATFFTNAINTQSKGIDYIASNKFNFEGFSLKTDLAGTVSRTRKVGDIKGSDILKNTGNINNYFDEASRIYLESAVPRSKLALINTLTYKKIEFFLRHTYFGAVTDPNTADINGNGLVEGSTINGQFLATEHPTFGGRTITDLSIGFSATKFLRVTVGANNIFDIYPDKNLKTQTAARYNTAGVLQPAGTIDLSNNNQFEYSRNVSQFGFNGRYVFARLSLSL